MYHSSKFLKTQFRGRPVNASDNLRNWELVSAIADYGTLSAAADAMGLELSTASRMVSALEAEIGLPVLDRRTKPAGFAERAEVLLPLARALVQTHRSLLATAGELSGNRTAAGRGLIRVSFPLNTDCAALFRKFLEFDASHPGIRIQPLAESGAEGVLSGKADVAKLNYMPRNPGLHVVAGNPGVTMLLASRRYLEKRGVPRKIEDLARHTILTRGSLDRSFTARLECGEQTYSISPDADLKQGDAVYCENLLLAGVGIAVDVSLNMVREQLLSGEVVPVLPGWHREPWRSSIVCRRSDLGDPLVQEVMALMLEEFNRICGRWREWYRRFGVPEETVRL